MTTASPEVPTVEASQGDSSPSTSILDKTLCLLVARSTFGVTRKAKGAAQTIAAEAVQSNPQMVALSKRLFVAPEYKAIKTIDGEFRSYLDGVALPSLFKGGTYAIPIPLVEQVDDKAKEYIANRKTAVAVLVAAWERIVADAETELGPTLFDPRNYPSAERIGSAFDVQHRWISYSTPAQLKQIKASIWSEERAKAQADVQTAAQEAIGEVRGRALKLVKHIVERLTPESEGDKKKVFKSSMIDNVKEFLDIFPVLNTAAGDAELAPIVERARLVLDGVDAKMLRDDELVRQKVQEEFAAIEAKLDGMVVEQTRKIVFDDDEAQGAA
jgi:hypothetical protein